MTAIAASPPWVAGVEGGVGTTTLAQALGIQDAGLYRGGGVEVLVCRSTARSVLLATSAAADAAAHGIHPVLAVTADGPWPLPPVVRPRLRMLGPSVTAVVHLPYVARWRQVDTPLASKPPQAWLEAAQTVLAALYPQAAAGWPTRRPGRHGRQEEPR